MVSDANENLLRVNIDKFFTDLEHDVQEALFTYYNENKLLKGQLNLILAPIHEKHREYYNLLMAHKLDEFRRSFRIGTLLTYNAKNKVALKSEPVKFTHNENNLFGTLEYTEQKLAQDTFNASDITLQRVDENINQILTDGYKSGKGINEVSRSLTERFDQLRTWESNRIARTEIHTAQNMGIMSSYESLGVEYTQWIAAQDDRTRDSHAELDGEIIRIGDKFSNGLEYPGDKNGDIEEWINCRCSNAPFVMPAGMTAPEGMEQFRESDLVPIQEPKDFLDQTMADAQQSTNEWDINRLTPPERKQYLNAKHNYTILKEAIEKGDYSRLDELKNTEIMEIHDKDSFMKITENGTDFEIAKYDLEDYKMDIDFYEIIIKDTNLQVSAEPVGIKWNRPNFGSEYVNLNSKGEYEPLNLGEKFIKYHFKNEGLTIYESVDMDYTRVRHLYDTHRKLPKHMQRAKELVLSNQVPVSVGLFSDSRLGGYVLNKKGNTRIYQFKRTVEDMKGNYRHENAHLIERDLNWYISNSKEYIDAFYADMRRLKANGYAEDDTYITPYSRSFTKNALSKNSTERPFSEDFAESVKYYLKDKEAFTKMYPNKAKVIEKAINGELTPENTTNYWKWKEESYKKFELTDEEMERYMELEFMNKPYVQNSRELTKAEQKEFQYLKDKKTFDYLNKQLVKGEELSDKEVEEFMRLQKKHKF